MSEQVQEYKDSGWRWWNWPWRTAQVVYGNRSDESGWRTALGAWGILAIFFGATALIGWIGRGQRWTWGPFKPYRNPRPAPGWDKIAAYAVVCGVIVLVSLSLSWLRRCYRQRIQYQNEEFLELPHRTEKEMIEEFGHLTPEEARLKIERECQASLKRKLERILAEWWKAEADPTTEAARRRLVERVRRDIGEAAAVGVKKTMELLV